MKIISGGQTGADQGGLAGAKRLGLETGGWIPKNFRTEQGSMPLLGELYGLKEHSSYDYPPRTRENVRDSDGTVWVGPGDSAGYRCTRNAVTDLERQWIANPTPDELRAWVRKHSIKVLNVAGPRASRAPSAWQDAFNLITETFGQVSLLE